MRTVPIPVRPFRAARPLTTRRCGLLVVLSVRDGASSALTPGGGPVAEERIDAIAGARARCGNSATDACIIKEQKWSSWKKNRDASLSNSVGSAFRHTGCASIRIAWPAGPGCGVIDVLWAMLSSNLPLRSFITTICSKPNSCRYTRPAAVSTGLFRRHDRRVVHQRRADGHLLLLRGPRNQARGRARATLYL